MRFIAAALCMAPLALSAGGVSLRDASADPGPTPVEDVQEYTHRSPAVPNTCPARTPQRPVAIQIPIERLEEQKKRGFVSLNTRGYNYPRPDDPPERFVPDSTGRHTRPMPGETPPD